MDITTDVEDRPPSVPKDFVLFQNTPNPLSWLTEIRYMLPRDGEVDLTIYSINGRVVRKLVQKRNQAGEHRVFWDGKDGQGRPVASGIEVDHLVFSGTQKSHRMLLLR